MLRCNLQRSKVSQVVIGRPSKIEGCKKETWVENRRPRLQIGDVAL